MNEELKYSLFHGTNTEYVQSILKEGIRCKPDPQDWLGHGVYFFTNGLTCPRKNAAEWAKNRYYPMGVQSVSVMQTQMKVKKNKILNLTTLEGLKKYNEARNAIILKNKISLISRRDLNIKKRKDFRVDDQIIMNIIIKKLNVDVVIANLYIKNSIQRDLELESCFPNSTVVSVINTDVLEYLKTAEVSRYSILDIA